MKLAEGAIYEIVDLDVPQGLPHNSPRAIVHEVHEYKGQYIVYGSKFAHEQHIYIHGYERIPERILCFVVIPQELVPARIHAFSKALSGRNLAIREGENLLYIVNWGLRLGKVWWLKTLNDLTRAGLLSQATQVVDWYLHWQIYGELPQDIQGLIKASKEGT